MEYFVGLDVSVKETSVCIVDDGGQDCCGKRRWEANRRRCSRF